MRIGPSLWTPRTGLIGKFHSKSKQGGRRGKGGENKRRGEERVRRGRFHHLGHDFPIEMILMANVADFFRLLLLRTFLDTDPSSKSSPQTHALEGPPPLLVESMMSRRWAGLPLSGGGCAVPGETAMFPAALSLLLPITCAVLCAVNPNPPSMALKVNKLTQCENPFSPSPPPTIIRHAARPRAAARCHLKFGEEGAMAVASESKDFPLLERCHEMATFA